MSPCIKKGKGFTARTQLSFGHSAGQAWASFSSQKNLCCCSVRKTSPGHGVGPTKHSFFPQNATAQRTPHQDWPQCGDQVHLHTWSSGSKVGPGAGDKGGRKMKGELERAGRKIRRLQSPNLHRTLSIHLYAPRWEHRTSLLPQAVPAPCQAERGLEQPGRAERGAGMR